MFEIFTCPKCLGKLKVLSIQSKDKNEKIQDGVLGCIKCKSEYPIKGFIPRFVPLENYASSFGFQWNKHAKTQIDKFSNISLSRDRFFKVTEWQHNLKGQKIMEAGCGAGRFTQVALETGAQIFSFDLSNAVDANQSNNGSAENINLFQADIYNIPVQKESFDKIFCFGVLQHCPGPKKAFMGLVQYLKPGGEIAVDIYDLTLRFFVNPKYWLRPLTVNLPPEKLYKIVSNVVPKLYPIKKWITEQVPFGKYFAFFIPVAYHKGFFPQADALNDGQLLEWSILDTFDKFAPKYDKPQTINTVKKWLMEAGLINIKVCYGPNGINAKGTKPEK